MRKTTWMMAALAVSMWAWQAGAAEIKVGVAWYGKSGMADSVAKGMEQALKELAPDIQLEYQKDLKDAEELAQVIGRFQQEKQGMVILRSNGAEYLVKNPPAIPTFIGACNNPADLGLIKNLKAPEGKVTGVSYSLSYDTQFETFLAIVPKIQSLALLLEEGHPSSAIDRAGTQAICKKLKIEYQEKLCKVYKNKEGKVDDESRAKTFADVTTAVNEYKGKVSIILLGNQALYIDNAAVVMQASGATPVFSYAAKSVKDGALCGLAADDIVLGKLLGESIVAALVKGTPIAQIPVQFDPKPQLYINAKTAETLKLEVPYEILSVANVVGVEKN